MDSLTITGGVPLKGSVAIEGAKNALLPLMATALLTTDTQHLHNAPNLSDTRMMIALLQRLGCQVQSNEATKHIAIKAHTFKTHEAPYDYVRKMRASILVLAPLLARLGQATVSLPGGCAIGVRPVNFHIQALEALGASITLEDGLLKATAPKGLQGGHYTFPKVSVTGTANMLMGAVLAQGDTCIENAACEPEIDDVITCLQAMGANITRDQSTLHITGVTNLKGVTHHTIADRIETGTYILAAAMTGSKLTLHHTTLKTLPIFTQTLRAMGVQLTESTEGIHVTSPLPDHLKPTHITTAPYPGFPTDLQAQLTALLTLVPGQSTVKEVIFENRFMHVAELMRMGADLTIEGNTLHIQGRVALKGAPLMATDIRASACLVLAPLAASGTSTLQRIYHLDRGYARMEEKLAACGAQITRVSSNPTASLHPRDTAATG